jgi:UDP-glucose 6-dehydrogenase
MERFSERIIVWPEFIRQNHWEEDCLDPKFVILGGAGAEEFSTTFGLMPRTNVQILTARDAMLYKLTANAFLATKVVMANAFYMLSDDWESLSRALMQDARLGETHWQVPGPDGQFGFGGACFPKDMETLITELGDRGVGSRLFQQILNLNEEVRHGKV